MSSFDTTIYPVGFCISPFTSADFQTPPSNTSNQMISSQDTETHLAIMRLDQDRFSTTLVRQINALGTSFQDQRDKLKKRIQSLISTNTALQLVITNAQFQSGGVLLLRDECINTLKEQNKKMKEEKDKLIASHEEYKKRMQEQIDAIENEGQQNLSAAKAIWEETENTLYTRLDALRSQLNIIQSNLNNAEQDKKGLIDTNASLSSQLTSVRSQVDTLQKTINEGPRRQQAAINTKKAEEKQKILESIDSYIKYYKEHTVVYTWNLSLIHI